MTPETIEAAFVHVSKQKPNSTLFRQLMDSDEVKSLILADIAVLVGDLAAAVKGEESLASILERRMYGLLYIAFEAGLAAKSGTLPREFDPAALEKAAQRVLNRPYQSLRTDLGEQAKRLIAFHGSPTLQRILSGAKAAEVADDVAMTGAAHMGYEIALELAKNGKEKP